MTNTSFRHSGTKRAFTLIELLVVVAIIGLLSSIVFASLGNARNKGVQAAVRQNLSSIPAQAGLFHAANGDSYANLCANTSAGQVRSAYDLVNGAATTAGFSGFTRNAYGSKSIPVCNDSADAWAAQVAYVPNVGLFFCIDSNGYATTTQGTKLLSGTDFDCSN